MCRKAVDDMPSLSLLIAVLAVKDTLSRYLLIDIGDKVRESHEYREARKEPFKPGKYMYLSIYSNTYNKVFYIQLRKLCLYRQIVLAMNV